MFEGRGIGRTLLAVVALLVALIPITAAHAQATVNVPITIGSPPPVHSVVDANGVNLFTGL